MTSSSTNIARMYTHSTIPIFNGEFYDCWKDKMETFLRFQGLWDIVKQGRKSSEQTSEKDDNVLNKEESRHDALALHFIQQGVVTSIYSPIMESKTAKEAWERLESEYKGSKKPEPLLSPSSSPSLSVLHRTQRRHDIAMATTSDPIRRSGNFEPTIWDDSYLQTLFIGFTEEECLIRRDKLKEDVKNLIEKEKGLVEQLELLDNLRQLGLSYHFELEIKDVLKSINSMESINNEFENDIHGTALLFRLLREYDLDASQLSVNLINSFKSLKDWSKLNLVHDIKGMLSLYEASYLAIDGEEALHEAGVVAAQYLGNVRKYAQNPHIIDQIDHALELPLHWRMPRLHSRWFIDAYVTQENMFQILLELAKLDFNIVQSLHKKELMEMSKWWNNLGIVCDELKFARDRLAEHYLGVMGFSFEPQFWRCRKGITKIACFITTIDDIYDVYGTLDELKLFTEVVNKWEFSAIQQLPNYMKTCLTLLFNTMNEIAASTTSGIEGSNVISCLKQSWADLCKAYLTEARWYHTGYTPTFNEYLENGWVSISGILPLVFAYCISDDVTMESLNTFDSYRDAVRYSSIIFRLYDDMATSKAEMQRGDVPKSIQCYMREKNVSESVARVYIKCLIMKYWKLLNNELATNFVYLDPFKRVIINIPRMAQCMFQNGDGLGEPNLDTRERIISLLIEPIPL